MDQLEEIKSKIDIVVLINERMPLKKAGRNFKARCPFHAEDTPSFIVSPERQIFKCFGCGEGGDIFGFLMKYEHLEFGEALKFLADKAGVKLKREYQKQAVSDKEILYKINFLAAEFFHHLLLKEKIGSKTREYLKKRKITAASIEKFKLGYAADSWDLLSRFLQKKGYSKKEIAKTGLIIEKEGARGYYDRFRQRLIFPIFNLQGEILGFSGRVIGATREGSPKYLNTPETPVYSKGRLLYGLFQAKEALRQRNELILVEGNVDVISAHQAGFGNIAAPLGTALTEDQGRLIKRFTENVLLSFDEDTAGDKAARRGIELLEKEGLNIKVLPLTGGKDLDECLQKDQQFLKKAVPKVTPIYDFYLHSAINRFSMKEAFGKKKITDELLPLFTRILNPIIKAHYLQKLAGVLGVKEETVFAEAEKVKIKPTVQSVSTKAIQGLPVKDRFLRLSEYLLALTLQKEELTLSELKEIQGDYLEGEIIPVIWQKLQRFLKENEEFLISDFYAKLEPEEVKIADESLLLDLSFLSEKEREQERGRCILEIKKLYLKKALKDLQKKIAVAEEKGESERLEDLNREFRDLTLNLQELGEKYDGQ